MIAWKRSGGLLPTRLVCVQPAEFRAVDEAFEEAGEFVGPCKMVFAVGVKFARGLLSRPAPARAMLRGLLPACSEQGESVDRDNLILPPDAPPETDPAYAEDGVDLTLIRWMLSLTPDERLRVLQERQDAFEAMVAAIPRRSPPEST